jgi:transcriptional regulator with XRE-family HTH domain
MSVRELGRYLRTLRPGNKPSLREVAERSGLSQNFLGRLERGEYETLLLGTLEQVAHGYGVSVEKLLAVAGYVREEPTLPDLNVYLRTKLGLSEEGIREAEHFIEFVQERYGKARRK